MPPYVEPDLYNYSLVSIIGSCTANGTWPLCVSASTTLIIINAKAQRSWLDNGWSGPVWTLSRLRHPSAYPALPLCGRAQPDRSFCSEKLNNNQHILAILLSSARVYTVTSAGTLQPLSPAVGLYQPITAAVSGDFALAVGWYWDLTILDLTGLANPFMVGRYDPNPCLYSFSASENWAYLIAFGQGWYDEPGHQLIPFSIDSSGLIERTVPLSADVGRVAAHGKRVVAAGVRDFYLYERDHQGNHTLLPQRRLSGYGHSLWVDTIQMRGEFVAVCDAGIWDYYDCSDPENIQLLGTIRPAEGEAGGASRTFCHCVAYATGGSLKLYDVNGSAGLALMKTLPCSGGYMESRGDTLLLLGDEAFRIIRPSSEGGLSVSTHSVDLPDWKVAADERLLIFWSGSKAKTYEYSESQAPQMVGTAKIPAQLCPACYAHISGRYLLSIHAFTGFTVSEIDPGVEVLRYNVSDSSGNPAEEKIRIVEVVGTAPFEIADIVETGLGQISLTWATRPGATYTVWSCSDLCGGQWAQEETVSSGGHTTTWTDENPADMCKFYRIEIKDLFHGDLMH